MKNFPDSSNLQPQSDLNPESKSQESEAQVPVEEVPDTPRCDWDLSLSAIVSSSSVGADAVGVIEFDPSGTLLATGGIARKIRLYAANSIIPTDGIGQTRLLDHNAASDFYICTPAKLSSLRWKPGSGSRVVGSGDYDGVVMEYDLEKRVPVFERDEHGGRRVWSMDYSQWNPLVGASGSDDGSVHVWDPRCEGGECVASVQPSNSGSPVCCVEFNPFGGPMLAVGCADRKAYGYDVRKMVDPVLVFDGHSKAVTYVRFLDHQTMVTSGTDGCLKLWHIENPTLLRTYSGHVNTRRFVGLSAWRSGGLIGCGSESNQVFVYDKRWGEPIWVHGFESSGRVGCESGFVSSVCWRQTGEENSTLVAGGSDGVLRVFQGKKRVVSLR